MEKNHIIGFVLIFATLLLYTMMNKPSEADLERRQYIKDSIALVQTEEAIVQEEVAEAFTEFETVAVEMDSNTVSAEEIVSVENEVLKLDFNTKGGAIVKATLKNYTRSNKNNKEELVELMSNEKNRFEYIIPIRSGGSISTRNMFFTPSVSGNKITLTGKSQEGLTVQQTYTLSEDYELAYNVSINGADQGRSSKLNWIDVLPKLENSDLYEQRYSTVYFKESSDDDADYCSCTSDDIEEFQGVDLDWISHSNQFFNASLMPDSWAFRNSVLETRMTDLEKSEDLKVIISTMELPKEQDDYSMTMYLGPNEYDNLKKFDNGLEQIIPYGSSLFGTINRHVVRPAFDYMSKFISSKGLVIILMIFLIKMMLYPLMYKMLHSQAKMSVLKPELAKSKEKYKDEPQKAQMESMKVYQEYGVSPLSGCMPMVLQMPIWIALYRFFPASITFRQESFLWANDLSTYDAFFNLPFEIPFLGSHLSLFTILWAVSTIIYTYYNSKHMDMSANPSMKYVQYFMPLMFLGFFNTYASGLTCYMFFSNLINILQTVITKKFVFDDDKIRAELLAKKGTKKKKKTGFQARLEEAMKQQRAVQEKKEKAKSKGKKK